MENDYIYNNGKIAMLQIGREYRIGKPAKDEKGENTIQNPSYCYTMLDAVRSLASKVADSEKGDLWDWIAVFTEVCETILETLKAEDLN